MVFTHRGFVLRTWPYGDSGRRVRLFTEAVGQRTVLAPRAREIRGRFHKVTLPFQEALWSYTVDGRGTFVLQQAEPLHSYPLLHKDYLLCMYATYWCEMVMKSCSEQDPQAELYRCLQEAFAKLSEACDADLLTRWLELRIASSAGWEPVVSHCAQCNSEEVPWYWVPQDGGRLCPSCGSQASSSKRVLSHEAQEALLALMERSTLEGLDSMILSVTAQKDLERACTDWLAEYMPGPLHTPQLLKTLQS